MEPTVDQILQQAVAAQKVGKLKEAEVLYQTILQTQPTHPDANHNLGVLAVSVNKSEAALPLFKAALESNPEIEQFWLSYVETLIKENQFETAKRVLKKGKEGGLSGETVDALNQQLTSETKNPTPAQSELDSLLEHYQSGQYGDAEKLATSITEQFPEHQFGWKVLGALLGQTGRKSEALNANQRAVQVETQDAAAHNNLGVSLREFGRLEEAEASYRQAIAIKSDFAAAHNNLGITLQELGRLEEAETSYNQAIALEPDYAEAHVNLGNTLKILGRLEEAEASYRQTIALKPDYAEVHYNLGVTVQELCRFEEAGASYRQAIALKPDYASAHSNLGVTLQELGRLEEAEASCRQAIALKPDHADAHNTLGAMLRELGRLEEAEASCRQAIALKPDYALAHSNLGIILYANGDIDSGLESLEKANDIDPKLKSNNLILTLLLARKAREKTEVSVGNISKLGCASGLTSNPLVLNRVVEEELLTNLYEMKTIELDNMKNIQAADARYGNGRCSPDFRLFDDERSIIKSLAEDLIIIMREAVKSDIYLADSFFNILGAGGGLTPHIHIDKFDADESLNFAKQKYSLVYYLSIGDQNCSDPGILKLYDPSEDILPCEGMIVIFPADRRHSVFYGGGKDRVIIGVNFYSL